MSEEKRDLKIKLKDDKGKYYEVISTEQFNIQKELNKEIEINIKYREVLDKIKEYIEKNKTKLYQGRNEFTCEIQYSDEVVKTKDILELLEEIE